MTSEYQPSPHKRPASTKQRSCLQCNETFDSIGPGNRICQKCKSGKSGNSRKDATRVVVSRGGVVEGKE